ncbi:hypothetical protein HBI25_214030 [Parastagonospora nodorum]|nr:hypothetical protein HBI95_005300 [Parastagonospora nodorum]KAH4992620.1 hypothetical protein HBI76_047600 [Parastagonospora nodorum]KAH5116186.1 hypothetical protein HBH71_119490 [Parastagonospora nodorum]KAH5483800.1 hypothetical protein HBI31_171790 [Parastagonospora nodorum]KAH5546710.1 hypothetical protein HBI25_214030 [Parastagonospora nodorum]
MSKSSSKVLGRPAKRAKKSNITIIPEQLSNSGLGFLDLPAELRNWVYDYVAHDDDPDDRPPTLHYRPHAGPQTHTTSRAPLRQGFALTQTCRLIRYEYLPIYQSHARVACSFQSLRACCIDKDGSGAQLVLPLGKTSVEYRMKVRAPDENGRLGRPVYDTEETDLLAIMSAIQRTPNLHLEFNPSIWTDIGAVLNIRDNPTWSKALDEKIQRIRLLPESVHFRPVVAFEVKEGYAEAWMARKFHPSNTYPFRPLILTPVKDAWLRKIGLGGHLDPRVVQVYRQHPHPLRRSPGTRKTREARLSLETRLR